MCALLLEAEGICMVNLLNLISESLGFWPSSVVMLLLLEELIFGSDNNMAFSAVACFADRADM